MKTLLKIFRRKVGSARFLCTPSQSKTRARIMLSKYVGKAKADTQALDLQLNTILKFQPHVRTIWSNMWVHYEKQSRGCILQSRGQWYYMGLVLSTRQQESKIAEKASSSGQPLVPKIVARLVQLPHEQGILRFPNDWNGKRGSKIRAHKKFAIAEKSLLEQDGMLKWTGGNPKHIAVTDEQRHIVWTAVDFEWSRYEYIPISRVYSESLESMSAKADTQQPSALLTDQTRWWSAYGGG